MKKSAYPLLARQAVTAYLADKTTITPPADLPEELTQNRSGVFVTIETRSGHKLRGCIGTYLPTKKNIALEIIANSIAAATEDYRFPPLTAKELPELIFTVSLLSEPQQIKTLKELDVKKYGVIIKTADGRAGLLLPDIESVDTPEKQVSIAAQKGGIELTTDSIYLFRFTVEKYHD